MIVEIPSGCHYFAWRYIPGRGTLHCSGVFGRDRLLEVTRVPGPASRDWKIYTFERRRWNIDILAAWIDAARAARQPELF